MPKATKKDPDAYECWPVKKPVLYTVRPPARWLAHPQAPRTHPRRRPRRGHHSLRPRRGGGRGLPGAAPRRAVGSRG